MKFDSAFGQRSLSAPLVLISAAFALATARADPPESPLAAKDKTAPYYQDAQLCRARSVSSSLPAGADPAVFLDVEAFLRCINQLGYRQDLKTDPLLVGLRRCGSQKTRVVTASGEVLWRAPSQAQMRVCLTARGFPSSGRPPTPNGESTLPEDLRSVARTSKDASAPTRPWESGDQDRVETVIIPPRSGAR